MSPKIGQGVGKPPADKIEAQDRLEQEAEERAAALEVERIDPKKLEVEPELAQHFNELEVSKADPNYVYSWVQSGFAGRFVKMKLVEGWEVVQGDMPEAEELKGMGADTTRRLGDVILMRIRRDRHRMLQRREKEIRDRQQGSVTGTLQEMGDRYRSRGVIVHTGEGVSPQLMDTMAKRATARNIAGRQFDQMIRQGRVPGVPAPEEE